MRCSRVLRFCAAHRLLGYDGPCANLHGHNYTVQVTIEGEPGHIGMVVDFGQIKAEVGGWLDEHWDHGVVCNAADGELVRAVASLGGKLSTMPGNPTAENMARLLLDRFRGAFSPANLVSIAVWETDDSWAEVTA